MPGAGYLCLAILAGSDGELAVAKAQFIAMLVLDGTIPVMIRVVAYVSDTGQLCSIEASVGRSEWTQHAVVTLRDPGLDSADESAALRDSSSKNSLREISVPRGGR